MSRFVCLTTRRGAASLSSPHQTAPLLPLQQCTRAAAAAQSQYHHSTRSSISRRRHFSSTRPARRNDDTPPPSPPSPSPPSPPESGYARLTSRRLISIAGVDAAKFLQGIITSSIQKVNPSSSSEDATAFYAGFLNATGRVLYDVFIYPDVLGLAGGNAATTTTTTSSPPDQAFIIEVDADQQPLLMRHLKRYKLRSKFTFQALDDGQATTWQVWGPGGGEAAPLSSPSNLSTSPLSFEGAGGGVSPGTCISLLDSRAPGMGRRVLVKGRNDDQAFAPIFASSSSSQLHPTLVPEQTYHIHRYLHGVPEGPMEIIPGSALPLESNMDLMGGIDFRKGCYVGQELTIRTKHRGVVRKRILPCVVYPSSSAAAGAPSTLEYKKPEEEEEGLAGRITRGTQISKLMDDGVTPKKGRLGLAGTWLSGVGNVGLALCRLQVMTKGVRLPGAELEETTDSSSSYDPDKGFVVSVGAEAEGEGGEGGPGEMARVKAFVPDWLRKGLEQQSSGGH